MIMIRFSCILSFLLLVSAPALAAGADRATAREGTAAAVEAYLDGVGLRDLRVADGRPVVAATSALGALIPEIFFWYPSIKGTFASRPGLSVDARSDVGLDKGDTSIQPQLQLDLGMIGLRISNFRTDFSGDAILTRPLDFARPGNPFAAGEFVHTDLRIENWRFLVLFPLSQNPRVRLAVTGGISYYRTRAGLSSFQTGGAEADAEIPIPVLGLLFQWKPDKILFEAEVSGLSTSFDQISGEVLEFQTRVGYALWDFLVVSGGWRFIDLDAHGANFGVDVKLEGFFFGISFNF